MSRQHFHTFDALRFTSFLLVFLLHLPKSGRPYIDFFLKSGGIGVSFFFVLSGFLITYILLYEKQQTGTISLKNFFSRRVLRIWPLFYLMIAFAYLSPFLLEVLNLPHQREGYEPNLLASVLFAENYMMMWKGTFPDGAPLGVMWSLCIEEHFYLLWGILFYLLAPKRIPLLIFSAILVAITARLVYTHFGISHGDILTNIDYFAFGAVPAFILMHRTHLITNVERVPLSIKYAVLVLTLAAVFIVPNVNLAWSDQVSPLLFGVLFSLIILFTLGNNSIHIRDNTWFGRLGIYTYGLYMYHTIVILLFIQLSKLIPFPNWYIQVATSLIVTIIVSLASYHLFEKQFLKLKKYFY